MTTLLGRYVVLGQEPNCFGKKSNILAIDAVFLTSWQTSTYFQYYMTPQLPFYHPLFVTLVYLQAVWSQKILPGPQYDCLELSPRWSCCGPESTNKFMVWSCSGPGRALVLRHRVGTGTANSNFVKKEHMKSTVKLCV